MNTERKVLTIERAKWLRGEGADSSYLLRSDGRMCCLGFDAIARGLTDDDILEAGDPASVFAPPEEYVAALCVTRPGRWRDCNEAAMRAISHNDEPGLAEDERERLIREDLIALGWDDVVFI